MMSSRESVRLAQWRVSEGFPRERRCGARNRPRTDDILFTREVLCQTELSGRWSGREDSNLRQLGSEPSTLARLSYTLMKLRGTDPVPHRQPLTPEARASPHGFGRDAPSLSRKSRRRRATPEDVVADNQWFGDEWRAWRESNSQHADYLVAPYRSRTGAATSRPHTPVGNKSPLLYR